MGISSEIRKMFPVLRQGIYVNTPTSGPLSEGLLAWRQEHDLDFLIGASKAKAKTQQLLKETRTTVAKFFNFNEAHIALVPSFSNGLNLLLEGLNPKEKVLLVRQDYPSLNWPFASRGFAISYVDLGPDIAEQVYTAIRKDKITVFACSVVNWQSGFKMDLDFLKQLKQDFPHLLILLDGTQYCGTEFFDFADAGADILGASGYKWLLGGYGNGFFMVKSGVEDRFTLGCSGFGSGRNAEGQEQASRFCGRLEPGHLDSLNFGSLQFSMQFLLAIGLGNITAHNQSMARFMQEELAQLGLLDPQLNHTNNLSTIFNIKRPEAYDVLKQHGVVCAQRGSGIRFGFHFFNTQEEVAQLLGILKK